MMHRGFSWLFRSFAAACSLAVVPPLLNVTGAYGHAARRYLCIGTLCGSTPAALGAIGMGSFRVGSFLDRVKHRAAFDAQLMKVPLYIATDDTGDYIVSHYPAFDAKDKDSKAKVKEAEHGTTKEQPQDSELPEQFLALFSDTNLVADTSVHEISNMERQMPKVALYFMDANACCAQIMELRRQGKEANIDIITLKDYVKQFQDSGRSWDPLLLPLSEGLVHATRNGKDTFKGTPVFTTDPPILKTTADNLDGEFDPKKDRFLVFLSPQEAVSFYRKAWWNKGKVTIKSGEEEYYRLLPGKRPFSPSLRYTSLEKVGRIIHSSEPFWGSLLFVVPPKIKLDSDTERILEENKLKQMSFFRIARKLGSYFL